jgi:hypothetical protein
MASLLQLVPNDNTEDYETLLVEAQIALRRVVDARVARGASFAEREVAYLDISNKTCRLNLEEDLQTIADSQSDNLLIDGVLYGRHRDGTADYHSLCGPLHVSRPTYRRVGERNGPTVVPLELEAGLIEGATPVFGYRIALGYAQDPGRQVEEQLRASRREPPSRSTLERIAKAIGGSARETAPRIEAVIREEEALPDGSQGVSVGLDRTTVPMEEERPADAPPKTRRKKRRKPYERTPPPPIDVNYRMAYVGTVSMVDDDGESLVTRRYAASNEEGPDGILTRMMADVIRAREQAPDIHVGLMQDGAPEMWNLTRSALKNIAGVVKWQEGIDRYHLNERLGEILRIVESDASKRERRLARWNDKLDVDDGTIDRIAMWLADKTPLHTGAELEKLEEHWTFLLNNNDRMRYASLRKMGLPCGSGATEGACKSLVMTRAKRCGQRWHDDGVNAVLTLRAIYMSERLPAFWTQFANDYTADVKAAA